MRYTFAYADKTQIDLLLPQLFKLLSDNMSVIAPTGNTYDEDYRLWFDAVCPAMQKPQRQIVCMYCDGTLVGYFQYYTSADLLMMEEIQIQRAHHGTGLFASFYAWLMRALPDDLRTVEAYANVKNTKSQGILRHLGLRQIGLSQNGNCYHYRGEYSALKEKYL